MTNEIERRVLEAIDMDALLDCLSDLIAFRSLGGEERPVQEYVAGVMRALDLEVDCWEIDMDRMRRHPAYTAEIDRADALGVVGRMGRGEGRTLILNGHVDVVPAGDPALWSVPPWEATIAGDRVYGRGTADMKGGLCCALFAVRAIRDAGVSLPGAVLIQSVVGEETAGWERWRPSSAATPATARSCSNQRNSSSPRLRRGRSTSALRFPARRPTARCEGGHQPVRQVSPALRRHARVRAGPKRAGHEPALLGLRDPVRAVHRHAPVGHLGVHRRRGPDVRGPPRREHRRTPGGRAPGLRRGRRRGLLGPIPGCGIIPPSSNGGARSSTRPRPP